MDDILNLIALTESRNAASYASLVNRIEALINHDFEQLVQILYKIDVSEKGLKETLKRHSDKDAAVLITDLILERQAQKKTSFIKHIPEDEIPDEEQW